MLTNENRGWWQDLCVFLCVEVGYRDCGVHGEFGQREKIEGIFCTKKKKVTCLLVHNYTLYVMFLTVSSYHLTTGQKANLLPCYC